MKIIDIYYYVFLFWWQVLQVRLEESEPTMGEPPGWIQRGTTMGHYNGEPAMVNQNDGKKTHL
jgi:hypothetical protein